MKMNTPYYRGKIAVYCGSRQVHEKDFKNYNNAINFVNNLGFEVIEDKKLFASSINDFYSPKHRAHFFNTAIIDREVKVLFSCKGGADCIAMLDYLDYSAIKNNPKIICGYSDITILINYINYKSKVITYWGPNFTLLGKTESQFCREDFVSKFINNEKGLGRLNDRYVVIREGCATGEIIGGTISSLSFLVAGKYNINFSDKILILEEFGKKIEPLKLKAYLAFFKQNGIFDKINALWIGNYENDFGYSLEQDILELTQDKSFPIIKSNNFGHIYENMIIPIGSKATINTNLQMPITTIK